MADSLKAKGKTTPIILSREQIESEFGQTLDEAAQKLNVSVSTLKRKCKDKGIKWQGIDHFKKNQNVKNEENDKGGAIHGNNGGTSLDDNMVTIKVEYAGEVIKFTLPITSATFEVIEKEIGTRFRLDPAHYYLKYLDYEEKRWILFTRDKDVTLYTKNKRIVQLLLDNEIHSRPINSFALFP